MDELITTGAREDWSGNREPSLADLLSDPVFLAVLRSDGLTIDDFHVRLGLPQEPANASGPLALAAA